MCNFLKSFRKYSIVENELLAIISVVDCTTNHISAMFIRSATGFRLGYVQKGAVSVCCTRAAVREGPKKVQCCASGLARRATMGIESRISENNSFNNIYKSNTVQRHLLLLFSFGCLKI